MSLNKKSQNKPLWFELPWPENPGNTYARHMETLDNCFDLIRFHQQCIQWSPLLEIKPVTTDCRAETLQLSHQFMSWENMALEVTMFSVKSTDVTFKTHSGLLAVQLPQVVNLASLLCDVDCWLSCRVSALQSVVTGLIFKGGDHCIHCWWDLIRSK